MNKNIESQTDFALAILQFEIGLRTGNSEKAPSMEEIEKASGDMCAREVERRLANRMSSCSLEAPTICFH